MRRGKYREAGSPEPPPSPAAVREVEASSGERDHIEQEGGCDAYVPAPSGTELRDQVAEPTGAGHLEPRQLEQPIPQPARLGAAGEAEDEAGGADKMLDDPIDCTVRIGEGQDWEAEAALKSRARAGGLANDLHG